MYIPAVHFKDRCAERQVTMVDAHHIIWHSKRVEPYSAGIPRNEGTCWRVWGRTPDGDRDVAVGIEAMKTRQTETWRIPKPANCECGGRLYAATLDEYDFSAYAGFKVTLTNITGLRCDKCHGETIVGGMINAAMNLILRDVSESPRRLHGEEARFLRRNLGITQEELSTRMGINRVTVAKWECGDEPISPQHDYILRGMILIGLCALNGTPIETANKTLRSVFGAVRTLPPLDMIVIDAHGLVPIGAHRQHRSERRAGI